MGAAGLGPGMRGAGSGKGQGSSAELTGQGALCWCRSDVGTWPEVVLGDASHQHAVEVDGVSRVFSVFALRAAPSVLRPALHFPPPPPPRLHRVWSICISFPSFRAASGPVMEAARTSFEFLSAQPGLQPVVWPSSLYAGSPGS